jgi:hypothetical protein
MARFKVYVDTGESLWSTNGLTFDTPEKAKEYGSDLWSRWTMVRKFAVVKIPEDFAGEWVSYLTPEQIEQMKVS